MRTRLTSLLVGSLLVGACANLIGLSDYDTDPSLGSDGSAGAPGVGGEPPVAEGGQPNSSGGQRSGLGGERAQAGAGGQLSDDGEPGSAGDGGEPACVPRELLDDGGFEGSGSSWGEYTDSGNAIITSTRVYTDAVAHDGVWVAWLGGVDSDYQELSQDIFIGPTFTKLTLTGFLRIGTQEASGADVDYMQVALWDSEAETVVGDTLDYSDVNSSVIFRRFTITWDVTDYRDRSLLLLISAETDADLNTNFFVDDLSLTTPCD